MIIFVEEWKKLMSLPPQKSFIKNVEKITIRNLNDLEQETGKYVRWQLRFWTGEAKQGNNL